MTPVKSADWRRRWDGTYSPVAKISTRERFGLALIGVPGLGKALVRRAIDTLEGSGMLITRAEYDVIFEDPINGTTRHSDTSLKRSYPLGEREALRVAARFRSFARPECTVMVVRRFTTEWTPVVEAEGVDL